MKKCKKCGAEIAKNAKVCPKCGARFGLPGFVKVLIVLGVIFICLFGCVAACTKGVSDTIDSVNESFEETENEYKDVNGKTEFNVNETFENKKVKLTMTSTNLDFKDYSKYADIKSGYKVISASFDIENIGESDDYFYSGDFNCYADDQAMEDFYYVDDSSFGSTISAGKKASGTVYFLVPKDADKITIEYDASWLDSVNIVFVVK